MDIKFKMFTYHFYPKQIEFYFKIKYSVVYFDMDEIQFYDKFYDPKNPYGIEDEEYFRV